jgi:hypothetical protein
MTQQAALQKLASFRRFIAIVPLDDIRHLEASARKRLRGQDEDDWPYLALALLLHCPIWTEDTDFFGVGVATWSSRRIEEFWHEEGLLIDINLSLNWGMLSGKALPSSVKGVSGLVRLERLRLVIHLECWDRWFLDFAITLSTMLWL